MRTMALVLALGTVGTAHAQTLDISGPCPGVVNVEVTGLTPGAEAAILLGRAGEGSDLVPAGPCVGVETGLAGIGLATRVRDADRDGVLRLSPTLSAPNCTTPIQVLDLSSCALTNVDQASDPDGIPCSEQAQIWCFSRGYTDIDYIGFGNLLCTNPATGPGSDCNACDAGWATVVWETADISPYGCGTFPMTAGRYYGGHSPCLCDGALLDCGDWDMAGCIPD
ncbi:MAG: hypothetical protein ACI8PZ_004485 [Myxococcota bacterium]|jgi:hypothetical protein